MKLKIISINKDKEGGIRDVTVLEGPILNQDDVALWNQDYATPTVCDIGGPRRPRQKQIWKRRLSLSVLFIVILVTVLIIFPLLHNTNEEALRRLNKPAKNVCEDTCTATIVESIPEGLVYPGGSIQTPSTFQTWLNLIEQAEHTIEIGSFYWTLRQVDVYPDPSSKQGEQIFQAILKAGTERGIEVKIAQNAPSAHEPNTDTELLVQRKAAKVKTLNFKKLIGLGVLHTKLWIIDRKHFYIGSANMDWRALTQVKELGILATNCSCLANDVAKIFDVYWALGDANKVPDSWPSSLETDINMASPMNVSLNNDKLEIYVASSPPPFCPKGRSNDIDAILNVIGKAKKFVYIAVMDYFPLMIYSPKMQYWPIIDNALRATAIENKVEVRMLVSHWKHSRTSEANFLKSLVDLSNSYPMVSISVRRFIVPANADQQKIPFARVNHNKYMVTDNTAYIGTSNWSGDYFTNTAGVGFVVHDPVVKRNSSDSTLRSQLQAVFERDWNSVYSHPVEFN